MEHYLRCLVVSVLLLSNSAWSQLTHVTLNQKVQNASLVIEGEVLAKNSFWDVGHARIYTVNDVKVTKVFKGFTAQSVVKVVTLGGTVGLEIQVVKPSLRLRVGDAGTFTLEQSNVDLGFNGTLYGPYSGKQGFYKYDKISAMAVAPFEAYATIHNDLYPSIEAMTGTPAQQVAQLSWAPAHHDPNRALTNFTPTTANAGTNTQITINGTGFGSTQGEVYFADADAGGASNIAALATQIISWSNTQIVVEVPSDAGTGLIEVVDAGMGVHTSASNLTVPYALSQVEFDPGTGDDYAYDTQHYDDNGSGGYTFQEFTDFANNSDASGEFASTMQDWIDETCINWTVGSSTSTDQTASDGINIVRFDNGSELGAGTLGVCTSYYSGCFGAGTQMFWFVTELDMTFDDGTNWNYAGAPTLSEYDFESVSLHELGHGHQLGHVINTNMAMHYALSNGEQNITISADESTGANVVMTRSTTTQVCGQTLMTDHSSCSACDDPDVPILSASQSTICDGGSSTITIVGNLDDATAWQVYTVSCGGTSETSTAGSNFVVSPTSTTTYYVRGEGGCVTPGACTSITITVNPNPNLSSTSSTDETCTGNDGTATVNPSGGSGSYSYLWDAAASNQTTPTATALAAGTYGVTVTDDVTTCNASTNVTVSNGCAIGTTQLKPPYCGIAPGINQYLFIFPVTGATNYEYRLTNQTTSAVTNFVRGNGLTNFRLSWAVGIEYGYTYDVEVRAYVGGSWGSYGTICTLTAPATPSANLRPAYCGFAASSLNDYVYSTGVALSQDYRYIFVEQGTTDTLFYQRGYNSTQVRLSWVSNIKYGTTYDVQVSVLIGGNWTAYGAVCAVTTPGFPSTKIRTADCGITLSAWTQNIFCDMVPGASQYEYEWTPQGGGTTLYYIKASSQTSMKAMHVAGIQSSTTYDVRVRAYVGGVWGTFGVVCDITTPSVALMPLLVMETETDQPGHQDESPEPAFASAKRISLNAWPNPSTGDRVTLRLDETDVAIQSVDVYNLAGQLVQTFSPNASPGQVDLRFGTPLTDGIYVLRILTDSGVMTSEKLIVRRP